MVKVLLCQPDIPKTLGITQFVNYERVNWLTLFRTAHFGKKSVIKNHVFTRVACPCGHRGTIVQTYGSVPRDGSQDQALLIRHSPLRCSALSLLD